MTLLASRERTRQILRGIHTDLARSDPQLAGLFAMFTLLTRGEKLPAAEKLKAGPGRMLARLRRAIGLDRPVAQWRIWPCLIMLLAVMLPLLPIVVRVA